MPAQNRRRRFETQLIFAAPPPLPVPPLPVAPLAAAFSDAAVALALAPLDTLATRRHIRPHSPGGAPSAMPAFRPFDAAAPAAAAAALDALAFVALYRFGRSALRRLRTDVAPRAVPLDTSRIAKEASPSPSSRSGEAVDAFVAGGAASVFTAILTTPATAAVRRMRVGGSSGSVLKGVRGLFCGVHATVARDLPFDALEFTVFEAFQRSVRKMRRSAFHGPSGRRSDMIVKISDPVLEALESVVAGAVTGAIVAAVVAPLDLCVTRMVVDPLGYGGGLFGCIRTIVSQEGGVRALFAGAPHLIVRETIGSGLFFGCYEGLVAVFGRQSVER